MSRFLVMSSEDFGLRDEEEAGFDTREEAEEAREEIEAKWHKSHSRAGFSSPVLLGQGTS